AGDPLEALSRAGGVQDHRAAGDRADHAEAEFPADGAAGAAAHRNGSGREFLAHGLASHGYRADQGTAMTTEDDISPSAFVAEFQRVEPWLMRAVARYGPTHDPEHILRRCLSGQAQLWTTETA